MKSKGDKDMLTHDDKLQDIPKKPTILDILYMEETRNTAIFIGHLRHEIIK